MISFAKPMDPPHLSIDSPTWCGTALASLVWRRFRARALRASGSQNGTGSWRIGRIPRVTPDQVARLARAIDLAWLGVEVVLAGRPLLDHLASMSPVPHDSLPLVVRRLVSAVPLDRADQNIWQALIDARNSGLLSAEDGDLASMIERPILPIDSLDGEAVAAAEANDLERIGEECEACGHPGLRPILRLRWLGNKPLLIALVAALFRHVLLSAPKASPSPAEQPDSRADDINAIAEILVQHGTELDRVLAGIRPELDLGERNSEEELQAGMKLLRGGNYEQSIAAFDGVLSQIPNCLEAHLQLAEAYRYSRDYPKALKSLQEAHALAPGDAAILFDRGVIQGLLGNLDAAFADYSSALRIDPSHSLAYVRRAGVHLDKGRRELAFEDLSKALQFDPSSGIAYQTRGDLLVLEQRFDQAIADYTQVIRRTPCCVDSFLRRGDAYAMKGDHERAIADYSQALRLDPLLISGYTRRVTSYIHNAKYPLAVADADAAARLDPDNEEVHHLRGLAFRAMGDHRSALADFDRVLRIRRDPKHFYERGRTYELQNDPARALADYDTAIELDSSSPLYYRTRGTLLIRQGRVDSAIADFTAALGLGDEVGQVYVDRAEAWIEKGRFDNALADCDQALECDPRLVSAYLTRGKAHAQQGDYARAEPDFAEAVALAPRNATAYRMRAQASMSQGEYDRALRDLRRSLELDSANASALHLSGTAYQALGRHDEALADLNNAMLLDPSYTTAYCNQRASLHEARGEYDQALADYAIVLQLDPANLAALVGREQVQAALKAAATPNGNGKSARPKQAETSRRNGKRRSNPRSTPAPPTQVHALGVATQTHVPISDTPAESDDNVAEFIPEEESTFEPKPILEIPTSAGEARPDQAVAPPIRSESSAENDSSRGVGPIAARVARDLRKEETEERARVWAEKQHRERQATTGQTVPPSPRAAKASSDRGPLLFMMLKIAGVLVVLGLLGGGGYSLFQSRETRLTSTEAWTTFDENTEAANKKFKGQFVQITGKIKVYPVGKSSRFFFEFPEGSKWGIECTLRQAEMKELKEGQTITIRGRFTQRRKEPDSNVAMSNCSLVKADP